MRSVAIAGVGYTQFTKQSGRSVLDLATEANRNAAADAGLPLAEIDGVVSYSVMNDSVSSEAVATTLALPGLRFVVDAQQGGQAPSFMVQQAAMAVAAGYAENVLVFRALNGRSGMRVGNLRFAGVAGQYRYPIGYSAYAMNIAMWAARYLHETGGSEADLAAVAIAQREYAQVNDRAILRKPLDMEAYLRSPMIAAPFRTADCTNEVDGACAVLVTTTERARDLRHEPAVIASAGYRALPRPGLDISDQMLSDDYTRNFLHPMRDELYGRAGITAADVDFAEIYDCFTVTVLLGLEGLGFCQRGEAADFIRSGATRPGGSLPVNTHGGLLSEGYLHGMNTVAEAALQVQGRCEHRQVPNHEVCVVTSGALENGSALVLTADR